MQRFKFELQSILDLRIREEDEAKAFLMMCELELQKANADFKDKKEELVNFQTREKGSRKDEPTSAATLKFSVSWRNSIKLDILKLGRQIQEISMDVARARQLFTQATIKRQALEKLHDKKKEEWQKEFNKQEQKFLDELAQTRHNIRKIS
ncbi:MAG: flagellar export protein FliJ [Chitinivibrionia bacterium]|nr:flagellar export protein FliJ [Chitinivibrionia bacterium]